MSCSANPGALVASARAKSYKRALAAALGELQTAGDAACAGGAGNCGGNPCEWVIQTVNFTFEFDQATPRRPIVCTATGSGSCECT